MVEENSSVKRLILLLLKNYARPMERRVIHMVLHTAAQSLETDLGFHGRYPYSTLVDRQLNEMISDGLLRQLYVVGPHFMELYKEYISLGEKGKELVDKLDEPELEKVIKESLRQLSLKQGGDVGSEA